MSDQDSFIEKKDLDQDQSNANDANASHNNSTPGDELGQTVSQLVGEGKKYKSLEDLAKAKLEADAFIEQLKTENGEMREDIGSKQAALDKAKSIDEALDSIKRDSEQAADNQGGLSEEDLAKLIDTRLDERTEAEKQSDNKRVVNEALIKRFGEEGKANAYVAAKAQEMGTSVKEMQEISKKNPEMFFRLLGIEPNSQEGNRGTPAGGQHNTEALLNKVADSSPQQGTWKYYQDIRKSNPKHYYSPKVQNEIFEQRKKLGDSFYN